MTADTSTIMSQMEVTAPPFQHILENPAPLAITHSVNIPELTRGMQKGHESAFQVFYDTYFDRLFRYLLVMSHGNETLAREVLQTSMLRIVRNIKPFESEQVFWNWLTVVVRSTCIDAFRKGRRDGKAIPLDAAALEIHQPSNSGPPIKLVQILEEGLGLLSSEERALIEAAYFDKRTSRSLAEESGRTVKAVESKLARVRDKLRRIMLLKLQDEDTGN